MDFQMLLKKMYVRGNYLPIPNKSLPKAIMKRTKLQNSFLKNRTKENEARYTEQKKLCVTYPRRIETLEQVVKYV